VFETSDDDQVFVGVVSDKQWKQLCEAFGLDELAADQSLATNNDRVAHKERLLPIIKEAFRQFTKVELMDKLEATGLPFAPIAKPEELFDDPHLNASGGLLEMTVTDGVRAGEKARLPALPLEMDGRRFGIHRDVPRQGQHTREIMAEVGYSDEEIDALIGQGAVGAE
jgi:crotonobetainyl-CoA:carnitine CoA-transferase CaiB-like acyl-CoA transferase